MLKTHSFRYRCRLLISALIALICLSSIPMSFGQGCIAVRGGGHCTLGHPIGEHVDGTYLAPGDWQVSLGYRWLKSDKHFRGDEEQKERQELGTEVINDQHFIDVSILYAFTPRLNAGLTLPFSSSRRSSLYEHDRRSRHTTESGGLGDIRLTGYAWLHDPATMPKGNVSFGIGPKFPTGNYEAGDTFYSTNGPVIRAVDQSIQVGDGGFGFSTELFAYYQLLPRTTAYLQAFYLFNPENKNGVSTRTGFARGNPFEQEMSIADQYLGRAGFTYALVPRWGLSLSLGGRIEGVPVEDALGASDGFRRPGYAISIEPGLGISKNQWAFNVAVPVAVYRNRERSLPDKRWTETSGIFRHGDAAFADFVITTSLSKQF